MRYEILEVLKKRAGFVSGEELGDMFKVSRSAIWKNINRLKDEGYEIESVSKRGYRLIENNRVINAYEIGVENCIFLPEVDSTNTYAKNMPEDKRVDKLLITCGSQTKGRGRLGRSWLDMGDNVCMSYVFKPHIMPSEAAQLTLVTGLALSEALEELSGIKIGIKWPNDLIAGDKKLAGILSEMSAEMERVNYVIIGVGINVNCKSFEAEIRDKATSLSLEAGKDFSRTEVIRACTRRLFKYYDIFCEKGFDYFIKAYEAKCINIGKRVKAIYRNSVCEGTAVAIDKDGGIVIKTDNDENVVVASSEVSLRLGDNKYI